MSFCAAALSYGFTERFGLKSVALFVFCTTLLVYCGQRYYKMNFTNLLTATPRIIWMSNNKRLVELILLFAVSGIAYFGLPLFIASEFNYTIIGFCTLVSIFYVVKIGKYNLREIPSLKVFLITLVFFVIIFILPYQTLSRLQNNIDPIWWFTALFVCQYLYILGITILFDIPDIKSDSIALKTIAQIVGERRTFMISVLLTLPFFIFLFGFFNSPLYTSIFVLLHVPFYYGLHKIENKQFYLSFFGESVLFVLGTYYYLTSF